MKTCPSTLCKEAVPDSGFGRWACRLVHPVSTIISGHSAFKGILSVADQGVVSATSFLTSIIVARTTSREDLGIYYLALTLFILARGVQTQIITAPYVVYCPHRQREMITTYTGSVIVHQLIYAILATICLIALGQAMQLGFGFQALAPTIWILMPAMPAILIREFHRHYSISHLKIVRALILDGMTSLLQLSLLFLLWYYSKISVAGVFAVMGMAAAIISLEWFFQRRERWCIAWSQVAADWKNNWHFGRWALGSHLAGCSTPYIMPWILATVSGEGATGLYCACGTLVGVANVLVIGMTNYLTPNARRAFISGGKATLCRLLGKAAVVFGVPVGAFCLLSVIAGEYLIVFVYGPHFAGGGPILTVLMLSLLVTSIQIVAGNGLWAMERPQATLLPDTSSLAITLGTAALLVGPLGPIGAALAGLAGSITGAAMKLFTLLWLIRSLPKDPALNCNEP
ncbi:MAG: lipopolysaccharide biosynthesis protein [Pirellulales bacterium]|nr:lipopolysaccharide biosynthesis protein [Pirellulales bacterium]